MTPMLFFDAHNHLHDAKFSAHLPEIIAGAKNSGIEKMVVNGTAENDWNAVASLAEKFPDFIIPAFGLHPWNVGKQSENFLKILRDFLEKFPMAPVGETGLDKFADAPAEAQLNALREQMTLAKELRRPVILHCVKMSGALEKILCEMAPLPRGFLLHSYSGSIEQIKKIDALGGYFSCAGNIFAAEKIARRKVFQSVPFERLLIETDAPNMTPPAPLNLRPDLDHNHPANLLEIYAAAAALRKIPLENFAEKIAENFKRLLVFQA